MNDDVAGSEAKTRLQELGNLCRSAGVQIQECQAADSLERKQAESLTIVVVEDHDDARRYVSVFLRQLGATVFEARNGIEALEAIKTHRPTLVLSDIFMPGADGFEMVRAIRTLENDGRMPVIAMSAVLSEADRRRILAAGFSACVPKPFTPNDLLKTIRSVLARKNHANSQRRAHCGLESSKDL
jgi:CheY-like chemotaxis protein